MIDMAKASRRIAIATEKMNTAPTIELTAYWVRIWRARRRIYRIAATKQIHLTSI